MIDFINPLDFIIIIILLIIAGIGVYSEHQKQKKMGTHARLKKELKRKGFI